MSSMRFPESSSIVENILNNDGVFTQDGEGDPPIKRLYIYEGLGNSKNFKLCYRPGEELYENPPYVVNPRCLWQHGRFTPFGIEWCRENMPGVNLPEGRTEEMSFEDWKKAVDKAISDAGFPLGCDDAADWPSRDCYDSGMSPKDAAMEWAEYQDMPEELLDMFTEGD